MADAAVRYFAPDSPALARTLRAKLEKLKADYKAELTASQDWPDFKLRCGVIRGLIEAIDLCAETEKDED